MTNQAQIYPLGTLPNNKVAYEASSGIYDVDISGADAQVKQMLASDDCELVINSELFRSAAL